MAIPGFQAFMLPLLRLFADGEEHALADVRDQLADELQLTADERAQLIPSGRQTRVYDRASWARAHLGQARLLESPRRGVFRITPAGSELLAEPLQAIDMALLMRYASYRTFRGAEPGGEDERAVAAPSPATPADELARSYRELRSVLAADILEQIAAMKPQFFEKLIVDLMLKLGYGGASGGGRAIGKGGDGGIDGVINEDKLGLDAIYLQAKRWGGSVGRPDVQAFVGSLVGRRATKGVFMTTGSFTADARAYVENIEKSIVLIDGKKLADLMIDAGLGVVPQETYVVNRIDADYFAEEA